MTDSLSSPIGARALDLDSDLLPLGKICAGDGENGPVLFETRVNGSVIAAVVPHPASSRSLPEFKARLLSKQVASFKLPDHLVITKSNPRRADGAVERTQNLAEI